MSKWFPVVVSFTLISTLILSVLMFFSGLQLIVFALDEWKNSWFVIFGMAAWLFGCLFAGFGVLEFSLNKTKLHLLGEQ
ncbi:hypothetical protein BCU70_10705 [Vibrio sp. 10N.286.49.C2]|uniref:hypothetical protein n=1 Tax=unclassified Vibrio TaxID=2614977 RepID=UPI000C84D5C9|nr:MULTISPECIES: hypothetical protein [unclassified Vibrio]PMH40628.1 hypothetical protein BCU70_10705 [Vibrio sp. 10N.286.49.C2]PMH45159.1 hypothetical protein BCU66_02305 [Vibrio sp. 10N.286.49.B1]PMH83480.1 hypothetical protein BCU58_14730 [Vibrio sp. 10N.286.48.B7]